jgi:hypothetical protein
MLMSLSGDSRRRPDQPQRRSGKASDVSEEPQTAGQASKGREPGRAVPVIDFVEQKTPHQKSGFAQNRCL